MHCNEILKSPSNEAEVFWGEISPCEHLVHIYQDDDVFLNSLEGFVSGGILAGDGVVVIATPPHLASLQNRLINRGIDDGERSSDRSISELGSGGHAVPIHDKRLA